MSRARASTGLPLGQGGGEKRPHIFLPRGSPCSRQLPSPQLPQAPAATRLTQPWRGGGTPPLHPTATLEEQRALFKNMFMYTCVAGTVTFIEWGPGAGGDRTPPSASGSSRVGRGAGGSRGAQAPSCSQPSGSGAGSPGTLPAHGSRPAAAPSLHTWPPRAPAQGPRPTEVTQQPAERSRVPTVSSGRCEAPVPEGGGGGAGLGGLPRAGEGGGRRWSSRAPGRRSMQEDVAVAVGAPGRGARGKEPTQLLLRWSRGGQGLTGS